LRQSQLERVDELDEAERFDQVDDRLQNRDIVVSGLVDAGADRSGAEDVGPVLPG
jgi:hypothetical protein